MYKLIKSENRKVSPKRCEDFLKKNTFAGQRALSQPWVQNVSTKICEGGFTKAHIAFAKNGAGVDVLMNGQHQCHACIQAGLPIDATIDYYHCDSETDMWHLFATFDSHRQRTEGHVMKAAKGLFRSEALRNVPLRVLSSCGSALLWLGGGVTPVFSAKVLSKSDKADLIEKYEQDVLRVASYGVSHIHVAVTCAIIATHRVNDAKAREFWTRVLHGDQLVRNSPQWSLHHGIAKFQAGARGGGSRNVMLYRLCILWWNAFATGERRTIAKYTSMKGIPEIKKCR